MTSPRLATEDRWGRRIYRRPLTGEEYQSITTFKNKGTSSWALDKWKREQVARTIVEDLPMFLGIAAESNKAAIDWAISKSEKAANNKMALGTYIHAIAEARLGGHPIPEPDPNDALDEQVCIGYAKALGMFLDEWKPDPILIEYTVFNTKCATPYAGTGDLAFRVERGKRTIAADWKTGKALYADTALQVAAAAHAEFWIDDTDTELELPKFDEGVGILLRSGGPRSDPGYEVRHLDISDRAWKMFQYVQKVAQWNTSSSWALGNQLAPPLQLEVVADDEEVPA